MIAEKHVTLLHPPTNSLVEARIVSLTPGLAEEHVRRRWWNDDALIGTITEPPIDRDWDWNKIEIEHGGKVLPSEKVAIVTGETSQELQVQGAMMISTTPIESHLEPGKPCLLLELLFAAPRNRPDLNKTGDAFLRGAGTQLLRWAAWFSGEIGCDGRLRLDASPRSIRFYQGKRLQVLKLSPIMFEGVQYTPMELTQAAALELLAD